MSKVIEGFVYAEDVVPGFMIETRLMNASTGEPLGTIDWMMVECVHWTEWGIMFFGAEMLSGRKFFTNPIPASSLITGWRQ